VGVAGDADQRVERRAEDARQREQQAELAVAEVEVVPDLRPGCGARAPDQLVEQLDREEDCELRAGALHVG
jgi:hypothetical protein